MATEYNFFLTSTEVQKTGTSKPVIKINEYDDYSFLTDYDSALINSLEKQINPSLQVVSRVTTKGKLKFCNTDYISVTNYKGKELVNKRTSIITHPEMPKTIYNYIIQELKKDNDVAAPIRHLDKNGKSFWLNTQFNPNKGSNLKLAYSTKAVPTSETAVNKIKEIYNTLFLIEKNVNQDQAQKYFEGMLEMEYANYDGFLLEIFE